ncbi:hypothetical protein AMTRI_Chr09g33320 [Amborella trichopoda]
MIDTDSNSAIFSLWEFQARFLIPSTYYRQNHCSCLNFPCQRVLKGLILSMSFALNFQEFAFDLPCSISDPDSCNSRVEYRSFFNWKWPSTDRFSNCAMSIRIEDFLNSVLMDTLLFRRFLDLFHHG